MFTSSSQIGLISASYAAGPGLNLGEGKDEFTIYSLFFVLGSGYGAVEWETIAGRLSGLINTSQGTYLVILIQSSELASFF